MATLSDFEVGYHVVYSLMRIVLARRVFGWPLLGLSICLRNHECFPIDAAGFHKNADV